MLDKPIYFGRGDIIGYSNYIGIKLPEDRRIGSIFNLNGDKMGGKTGTTQVRRISMKERQTGIIKDEDLPWKLRNHALFVGFAPVDNPRYAVAVVVEHGSSGSGVAAPIASLILQTALELRIE